ncbi:MAG: lipase family protein, partial [Chromatiales bacterium]
YEVLGTPEIHTYMVGQSQGRVVLDMARAAQRLAKAGLSADAPVGLIGYSQGGAATGWAAELADSYAPELKIVGAAAGGVPADLIYIGHFLDGSLFIPFALMASVGMDAAYDNLNLESYLNDRGQELKDRAGDKCLGPDADSIQTTLETVFTFIDDFTTTNPLLPSFTLCTLLIFQE